MRRFVGPLVIALAACGSPSPSTLATASHAAPRPENKTEAGPEPFAVAAIDAAVDVVGERKGLALANGSSLVPWKYKTQFFPARGAEPAFRWQTAWRLVGSARPDSSLTSISGPVPAGDELVWRWREDQRTWESIVLRTPPILTTHDVAAAALGAERSTSIAMDANAGRTVTKEVTRPTIDLTLTDEGARKLATWAKAHFRQPIAYLVRGVVVDDWFVQEDESGTPMTSSLTLRSLGPATTEADLRAFVALLAERRRSSSP